MLKGLDGITAHASPEASTHAPCPADFIIPTFGIRFSVHGGKQRAWNSRQDFGRSLG